MTSRIFWDDKTIPKLEQIQDAFATAFAKLKTVASMAESGGTAVQRAKECSTKTASTADNLALESFVGSDFVLPVAQILEAAIELCSDAANNFLCLSDFSNLPVSVFLKTSRLTSSQLQK